MKAGEIYDKIHTGNRMDQQQVLFELWAHVQQLTVGVLELAGDIKRQSQRDPLSYKTRLLLGEFIDPNQGTQQLKKGRRDRL
jgi:hypothetical protein